MSFFSYSTFKSDLSLDKLLIKNPLTTFFWRLESDDFHDLGLYAKDILVVDKSAKVRKDDLIIVIREGEFCLVKVKSGRNEDEIWGVVVGVVKCLR